MLFGYSIKSFPVDPGTRWTEVSQYKKTLSEVIGLIDQKYYKQEETSGFVNDAIYELVDGLDPYSMYVAPYHSEMLEISNTGKYEGIGIETVDVEGEIYISNVIKGSPGDSAQILKGARVVKVNNVDLASASWNSDSLAHYLSDNEALKINFEMDHFSYEKNRSFDVMPSTVTVENISDTYKLNDETGYVRIVKFGNDSYKDFMESLESLITNDSLNNLVIDVRDNPGGYLQEVCKIISQLLPSRIDFLSTVDADGNSNSYKSTGQSFFHIGNVIVLIDEESASASEILAGVLQDMDRAIVVGEDSFGKGLVQEQFQLSNGGVLRLSVSRYRLPSGRFIGEGDGQTYNSLRMNRSFTSKDFLQPDFYVNHDYADTDVDIFKKAIVSLKNSNTDYTLESYFSMEDQIDTNLEFEKAKILFDDDLVSKKKILADSVVIESLRLLKEKDEWNILE